MTKPLKLTAPITRNYLRNISDVTRAKLKLRIDYELQVIRIRYPKHMLQVSVYYHRLVESQQAFLKFADDH